MSSQKLHSDPFFIEQLEQDPEYLEARRQLQKEDNDQQEITRPMVITYAKSQLETDIPITWTINKVKCMIASHFPMLKFDEFEFKSENMLIPGTSTIGKLTSNRLTVTQADCPSAFDKYYEENVKNIIKEYNIHTQSGMYPIFHRAMTEPMLCNIPKERLENFQKVKKQRNPNRNNQDLGFGFWNIMRFIGFAMLFNMITTMADYTQIGILVVIAIVYLLIEQHVNDNNRRRRNQRRREERRERRRNNNNNDDREIGEEGQEEERNGNVNENENENERGENLQEEKNRENERNQKESLNGESDEPRENVRGLSQQASGQKQSPENEELQPLIQGQDNQVEQRFPLKAKVILWISFLSQFFYCFALSIFPNWTVETHLHANQAKMDEVLDYVKTLDPEASQLIRDWKKEQQEGKKSSKDEKEVLNEQNKQYEGEANNKEEEVQRGLVQEHDD